MAVDAQGGIHMAYYYYEPEYGDEFPNPTHAVYRYCAARCDDGSSWSEVALPGTNKVNQVQLALTRAGQPRLLIRIDRPNIFVPYEYHYAACDANCASAAGWTMTHFMNAGKPLLQGVLDDDHSQRYFALDPQDRPRFVFTDRNYYEAQPDRYGAYYVYCDASCTDAANWDAVHIGLTAENEEYEYPALAFTSAGQPRIVAGFRPHGGDSSGIYYVACDAACGTEASWQRVRIGERGQGSNPGWDIEVDAQDRPRIAFYPEQLPDGSGRQLHYAWCDANCLDATGWHRSNVNAALGLKAETGADPDLELDPAGRPRIAMIAFGGNTLGYAYCDVNCEAQGAQWQGAAMDNATVLAQEWPVPFAPTCQGGLWRVWTPVLAFDPSGNTRLAYDATYHANCWWSSDAQAYKSYHQFQLIQRVVRGILITKP